MRGNSILFKTLLLSTSQRNIYKYTKEKKKKGRIITAYIGIFCLYAMLIGYSLATCIGYGKMGLINAVPAICAVTLSTLSFIFTFFKTNGYLFNFKEYDMLMSLPFEAKTIAACKFLYMYVKSLPWYLSISVAMLIGYGVFAHPAGIVYPLWIFLTLVLPLIPMLLAAFAGFIIAKIGSHFKKNNIVQTILTFIFIIFCFSIRYIIDALIKDDKVEQTLETIKNANDKVGSVYLPVKWFKNAILYQSISDVLLLIGVSLILFSVVFHIVGKSYRNINSALTSHEVSRNYKMKAQKKNSVVNAIAFKEFKRMTGSTVYLTNVAMGEVLSVIFGVVTLILGFNKIVAVVTQNAPFDPAILQPAIPFILYFFIGMVASTVCSPSLEGKNYWIVQSLPISKKTLYRGKMLFNMYLTVPFMLFGIICMCISAKVPLINTVLYMILGVALCAFSTTWGCVCGIRFMRLDWENEIEVIKQSAAVAIYMLPNMFAVMGLVVFVVILGMHVDHKIIAIIMIVIASVLAFLSYLRAMALAKRNIK